MPLLDINLGPKRWSSGDVGSQGHDAPSSRILVMKGATTVVSEIIAALIIGSIAYAIGVARGAAAERIRVSQEADARYQSLSERCSNEKKDAENELKRSLKQLMADYERELFWLRVVGRSYSSFTSYAADIKWHHGEPAISWHGREEAYDENHILFPTADDARKYGELLLQRTAGDAGTKAEAYRIATCNELPNALWGESTWMFSATDNSDVYVEVGRPQTRSRAVAKWGSTRNECWVPRRRYPDAWGVEGIDNVRFRTVEEANLYKGSLALASDEFYSAKVVEKRGKPNSSCYDGKLRPLV